MGARSPRVDNAERIANDLSRQVRSGKWGPGHVVPPLRTLAGRYGVSHETVRRALQALEDQGLVRKTQGRGTVVESAGAGREPAAFPPDPLFRRQLGVLSNEIGTEKEGLWLRAGREFMEEQPNLAVSFAPLTPADFHPLVDRMPSLLHAPTWQLAEYAAQGLLLDLRPFCEEAPLYDGDLMPNTGLPGPREPLFHVPLTFDIRVMYVNQERVTASELGALREKWSVESVVRWMAARAPAGGSSGIPRPRVLLALMGVEPMDVRGLKDNMKRLPGVLERMGALFREAPFYGDDEMRRDTDRDSFAAFLAQRLPLVFHHTFGMTTAMKRMKAGWGVLPVPTASGASIVRFGMSCAATRDCDSPEAAVAFIRFLTEARGQSIFAAGRTNIPVRRSVARSGAFLAAPPSGMSEVAESAATTREFLHGGSPAFEMAWSLAWDEELFFFLLRRRPVAEAVERLRVRCERLARAYGLQAGGPRSAAGGRPGAPA